MDVEVMSTLREVPCVSPLNKAAKKRKSLLERELETNMTEKMTSPVVAGENAITSRFGRARKLKSSEDFVPTEKMLIPSKKAIPRKISPPRSPTVFKMNASKSPVKIPSMHPTTPMSHSAVDSIDELLNQNKSLSRFSTDIVSPSKVGKVYVRRDLIQNRDEKTSSIMKNMFSPIKSPIKSLNNSSHLNTILQRTTSIDAGSKLASPQRTENKVTSPHSAQEGKKKLSPRQVSLIEHPSVIKTLNFSDTTASKKNSKVEKIVSAMNKTKVESAPVIQVDNVYEALEKSCAYQANDLAWARVGTYPFWPCLITRDPFSGHIVKEKVAGGRQVHTVKVMHVTFLADNGRRGWVHESMLRPFRGLKEFHAHRDAFTSEQKKKDFKLYTAFIVSDKRLKVWEKAVQEAEMLLVRPSHTRIDILYEIVYKPNQKSKDMPVPLKEKTKRVSIEKKNISLSESLFDSLFSEDDSKVVDKKRSKKSLDVSDVVTACLDDMASKTGNIKIQKQSHMDRWLQKAKSKTPEKAIETAINVAEKIRSRKNKRDIPSDDSDVSRTIQKLKKRIRNSANYSLRTDSSSGVDSEESKRNSLDERLHVKRGNSVQMQLNGNQSEIDIGSTNGHSSDQITPTKINVAEVISTPTNCVQSESESAKKDCSKTKITPAIEIISNQTIAIENSTQNYSSMLDSTSKDINILVNSTEIGNSEIDSNLQLKDINKSVVTNHDNLNKNLSDLDSIQSEIDGLSNNGDDSVTPKIYDASSDVEAVKSTQKLVFSTEIAHTEMDSDLEFKDTNKSVPNNHTTLNDKPPNLETTRSEIDEDIDITLRIDDASSDLEVANNIENKVVSSNENEHNIKYQERTGLTNIENNVSSNIPDQIVDSQISTVLLDEQIKRFGKVGTNLNSQIVEDVLTEHQQSVQNIQQSISTAKKVTLYLDSQCVVSEEGKIAKIEDLMCQNGENTLADLNLYKKTKTTKFEETNMDNNFSDNLDDKTIKIQGSKFIAESVHKNIEKLLCDPCDKVNGNDLSELQNSVQKTTVKSVSINVDSQYVNSEEGKITKMEELIRQNSEITLSDLNLPKTTETTNPEETNIENIVSNMDNKTFDFQGGRFIEGNESARKNIEQQICKPCDKVHGKSLTEIQESVQKSTVNKVYNNIDSQNVNGKENEITTIEDLIRQNSENTLADLNLHRSTETTKPEEITMENKVSKGLDDITINVQGSQVLGDKSTQKYLEKQDCDPCYDVLIDLELAPEKQLNAKKDDVNIQNDLLDINEDLLDSKDNSKNTRQEKYHLCNGVSDSQQKLKSLTAAFNTQKCVVFINRIDLKPHLESLKNLTTNVELSRSVKVKLSRLARSKRALRKRKSETNHVSIESPSSAKVLTTQINTSNLLVNATENKSGNFVAKGETPQENHTNIEASVDNKILLEETMQIKDSQNNKHSTQNPDTDSTFIQPETNVKISISECNLGDGGKNIGVKINNVNDDPNFLMYVESKRDMLMDANPDLTQDEVSSHLHSLWVYEESRKSKEIKSIIKTFETDCLVKSHDYNSTDKVNDVDAQDESCGESDDTKADSLNEEVKEDSTENYSETLANSQHNSNAQKPIISLKASSISSHELKEKQNLGEEYFISNADSDLLSNVNLKLDLSTNEESNKNAGNDINITTTLPNGFKTEPKQDLVNHETNQLIDKTPMEASNEPGVIKIFDAQEKLTICENSDKKEDLILAQDLPKSQLLLQQTDVSIDQDSRSLNSDKDIDEPEATSILKRNHKHSSELEDKTVSFDNFEDSLSSSSSESDMEASKKGNSNKEKSHKYDDPNFTQYMETKRDALMDEHPHLSEDDVLSYLYDMWSFSDNNKKDEVRNNNDDGGSLLKGLGQDTVVQPKRNYRKRVRTPKVLDAVTEVCIPKDKPIRKKAVKTYYNHDTDSDSELAEKPEKSDSQDKIEPSYLKLNGQIDDQNTDKVGDLDSAHSDKNNDQFIAGLLKPKPNVFKGLARERLCEICETPANLIKCRGHCGGMFHVECVLKQAELKPEGSRKKKKKQGRPKKMLSDSDQSLDSSKMNGLDSDGNSDEKCQENLAVDEVQESCVIEDADKFETQLEVKMKEILESIPENDNSLYSSGDELDWNNTVAGKCEIIDVKLRLKSEKKPEDFLIKFKCNDCQKYEQPLCFICKSVTSPKQKTEVRQKCNIIHCNKVYHLECLNPWPQTQYSTGTTSACSDDETEVYTCPRHVCHTCVCDDPRGCKTRFSGDKLARCVRCPAVYHTFTKCLPAGTKILNGSHIICPRHYEQKPGRVPYHVNTSWCFICALGGTLICCEYCPMSFHADCLNIQPPEDGYMCEDCETGRLPLYGELVWAKLGNYRWWPGVVLHPALVPDNVRLLRHTTGEFAVRFFGGNDHFWLHRGRVFPYQEGDTGKVSNQKSKIDTEFAVAVQQAQRTYKMLKEAKENDEERADIAASLLPPHYVRLKVNRPHGSLCGRRADPDEESAAVPCDCRPDDDEPCGMYTQCLNRVLLTECGPTCQAGDRCHNRCFELRLYPKLAPKRTPQRGWGLHTLQDIKRGQFVIEYVGELIDDWEFRRRMRRMHEMRDENYYFLTLDKERMIDAGPKGNAARFMNHSCEPNCETQKWTVLGDVRVGLFALRDIPAGSEVTFNYNLECAGVDKKRCMCGAARCAGYIGAKPKQEEPKPKQPKRKYKKKPRLESPSTSSRPSSAPKPRRSNTSLNASLKSREMLEIEQDLLIIRNATRDLPSDTDSEGKGTARTESKPSVVSELPAVKTMVDGENNEEAKVNGEIKTDEDAKATEDKKAREDSKVENAKANEEAKVNGAIKTDEDAEATGDKKAREDCKVDGAKTNEEPKVNGEVKTDEDAKATGDKLREVVKVNGDCGVLGKEVLIVSAVKCDSKGSDPKMGPVNALKRKRVSFSSEEVVICYDSGAPHEKRTRTEPPKGYEAAFYQFLKRDGLVSNASSSKD